MKSRWKQLVEDGDRVYYLLQVIKRLDLGDVSEPIFVDRWNYERE